MEADNPIQVQLSSSRANENLSDSMNSNIIKSSSPVKPIKIIEEFKSDKNSEI